MVREGNKVYVLRVRCEDDWGEEFVDTELWEAPRGMWSAYCDFLRESSRQMGIEIWTNHLTVKPATAWSKPISEEDQYLAWQAWAKFRSRHNFRSFLMKRGARMLDFESITI